MLNYLRGIKVLSATLLVQSVTTFASGSQSVQVDFNPTVTNPTFASDTGQIGGTASAFSAIDTTGAPGYRYFGLLRAAVEVDDDNISTATASSVVSGLSSSTDYLLLYIQDGIALDGSSSATTNITYGSTSVTANYAVNDPEPGILATIITGVTSVSVTVAADTENIGGVFTTGADASAILSIVEVTTNPLYHNDCDIDNNGTLNADDIDLLNAAIRAGISSGVSNVNAIAMFDVDDDNDVDTADRDELIEGSVCLNTSYGDADLDGDVDDSDLGTAFSNYTGPVGLAGGKGWADGDTDGDGDVDDSDLGTMYANYTE
ncbi:MAG: hypothetical protein ACE37H_08315 [Phycisphaeraceae bacterium]